MRVTSRPGWIRATAAICVAVALAASGCTTLRDLATAADPAEPVEFSTVSVGSTHACGLTEGGEAVCWGHNHEGMSAAPEGKFSAIAAGGGYSCGLRAGDGSVVCWGGNDAGESDAPEGEFVEVAAGDGYSCGLRAGVGSVVCWGEGFDESADAPEEQFTAIVAGEGLPCGLGAGDGSVVCWAENYLRLIDAPDGNFVQLSEPSWTSVCGVRADGSVTCWARPGWSNTISMAGPFVSFDVSEEPAWFSFIGHGPDLNYGCGVTSDAAVNCWDIHTAETLDAPAGAFAAVSVGPEVACGVRSDSTVECWQGANGEPAPAESGLFSAVSVGEGFACGLRTAGAMACWDLTDGADRPALAGEFVEIAVDNDDVCGVRPDRTVACLRLNADLDHALFSLLAALPVAQSHSVIADALSLWDGDAEAEADDEPSELPDIEQATEEMKAALRGTFGDDEAALDAFIGEWFNAFGPAPDEASPPGPAPDVPEHEFSAIAAGGVNCGLGPDGRAECWGRFNTPAFDAPPGSFVDIAVAWTQVCGVRPNGLMECWGPPGIRTSHRQAGRFVSAAPAKYANCGLRIDGMALCWRTDLDEVIPPPPNVTYRHYRVDPEQ